MAARILLALVLLGATAGLAWGQAVPAAPANVPDSAWQPPDRGSAGAAAIRAAATPAPAAPAAAAAAAAGGATPPAASPGPSAQVPGSIGTGPTGMGANAAAPGARPAGAVRRRVTHVTAGNGTMPNEAGQVWREYDISPYTSRVTTTKRPEQAIVDWILRDTGYEAWHSEPLAVLSATPKTLRVYHTPKMQAVVGELVERFVASEAETRTFSLSVITLDSPNWRARAQRLMHAVPVQTPGASAWLLQKEEAAVLLADLKRRSDYREHSSPYLLVNNGQSTLVSAVRGRAYTRDVLPRTDAWPGFEGRPGQIDEGFSLEFSPLMSVDGRTIDAAIKCDIDQVEKMASVMVDVPTPAAPRQRAKIDVPQIAHFRFHERFRWPVDQVLLVGMGMVAMPVPVDGKPTVAGVPLPLPSTPPRADLLVVIESKGPVAETPGAARAPQQQATTTQRRF
jgi:hypothetical protein